MEKIFEMHTKRVITMHQAVKQYPNLVVYKDENYVDGEQISSSQGFASLEHIQSLGKNEQIQQFAKDYPVSNGVASKVAVLAVKSALREELRKNGMGGAKWENLELVDNPFDVIEETGMLDMDNGDKYEVFYISTYSNLVESLDEKRIPQGIKFDYMTSIDNNGYHLKNLLEAIKERTDIHWKNRSEKAEITSIPSYNVSDGAYMQLEFRWVPSDEDYAKLELNKRHLHCDEVMEKIFGLDLSEKGNIRKFHTEKEF